MREIKFRMYDKKTKVMSPVHLMEWGKIQNNLSYYRGYYDCDKGDWSVIACNNPNKQTAVKCDGETFLVNRYELMQYTGLKDKNGKEIYEGDIMPVNGGKYVVVYSEDYARYCLQMPSGRMFIPSKNSEVIGNIYENPELLEG